VSERCRHITVDGERVFIPDCWGGVNYGPNGCYCYPMTEEEKTKHCDDLASLLSRVEKLEETVKKLAKRQVAKP
jgi:hypothetical protein